MTEQGKARKALVKVRRHGLSHTLYDVTLRAANTVVLVRVLRGIVIERPDPAFLKCPEGYTCSFLPAHIIRDQVRDPESGMSESFVEQALAKGDECYAIRDGTTLAAYGWYAFAPTRIDPPDLVLHFSPQYAYMYNGFTHPRYRGQRLHAIGMTMALREYLSRGLRGLVSYVDANNFDSLKSCFRMGYVTFGSVYVMRVFGRYVKRSSAGCQRYGFHVEDAGRRDQPAGTPRA